MSRLIFATQSLRRSHAQEVRARRNERRMMRYSGKAFSMSESEFIRNYRVSKGVFDDIYDELKPYMRTQRRRSDITPKYKILVALSFYATGSYQRLVGGTYGTLMSQQSVSRAIRDVSDALNHRDILKRWIKFPQTQNERDVIKRRFYEKFRIPAVLGCIDGTHVAIVRPYENEERFFNRKHFHSRNVQIICDADLNIMSVDAAFGGATHDSFIWNQHPIKNHIVMITQRGENVYLLGDSGYAQRTYMMTPIVDAAVGSPEEHYTKLHCTARNTVERCIGVLKNRWRCLLGHRVLHYKPDVAAKIINACCVLHNICNQRRIPLQVEEMEIDMDMDIPLVQGASQDSIAAVELRLGVEKRGQLVQQLWETR